jgi:hypothetical protein
VGFKQGCQMVCFLTKNPDLGKFWRVLCRLENVYIFYGHLEYFMDIWDILRPFGKFCVHFVLFPVFVWSSTWFQGFTRPRLSKRD